MEYDKEDNKNCRDEQAYYSNVTFSTILPLGSSIWSLYKAYSVFNKALGYDTEELDSLYEQ